MAIECITIANNHLYQGNPLASQHQLRYDSIISRQDWEVPSIENMEYDQYDNPATTYLVWRDAQNIVRGVSRFYPTDRPFMLKEHFSHMVSYQDTPSGHDVLEASRFCIDKNMAVDLRKRIIQELLVAYFEYALSHGITQVVGIMYPAYWRSIFEKNGCDIIWLGDIAVTDDGKKSRAGILAISQEILSKVRKTTGIYESILINKTKQGEQHYAKAA